MRPVRPRPGRTKPPCWPTCRPSWRRPRHARPAWYDRECGRPAGSRPAPARAGGHPPAMVLIAMCALAPAVATRARSPSAPPVHSGRPGGRPSQPADTPRGAGARRPPQPPGRTSARVAATTRPPRPPGAPACPPPPCASRPASARSTWPSNVVSPAGGSHGAYRSAAPVRPGQHPSARDHVLRARGRRHRPGRPHAPGEHQTGCWTRWPPLAWLPGARRPAAPPSTAGPNYAGVAADAGIPTPKTRPTLAEYHQRREAKRTRVQRWEQHRKATT